LEYKYKKEKEEIDRLTQEQKEREEKNQQRYAKVDKTPNADGETGTEEEPKKRWFQFWK
jgi:hypothetical protein